MTTFANGQFAKVLPSEPTKAKASSLDFWTAACYFAVAAALSCAGLGSSGGDARSSSLVMGGWWAANSALGPEAAAPASWRLLWHHLGRWVASVPPLSPEWISQPLLGPQSFTRTTTPNPAVSHHNVPYSMARGMHASAGLGCPYPAPGGAPR